MQGNAIPIGASCLLKALVHLALRAFSFVYKLRFGLQLFACVCRIIFIKNVCYSDQFGGLISLPSMFAFCESFQRLQCLQSFYIFKDFNVFSVLHFKDFHFSYILF